MIAFLIASIASLLFVLLIDFYLCPCYNGATFLFDWWRLVLGRRAAFSFFGLPSSEPRQPSHGWRSKAGAFRLCFFYYEILFNLPRLRWCHCYNSYNCLCCFVCDLVIFHIVFPHFRFLLRFSFDSFIITDIRHKTSRNIIQI